VVIAVDCTVVVCCDGVDVESTKDGNVLRLPSGRYSPVRRLSDGLTMVRKYRSQLEKVYKKALQNQVQQRTDTNFLKKLQPNDSKTPVSHTLCLISVGNS